MRTRSLVSADWVAAKIDSGCHDTVVGEDCMQDGAVVQLDCIVVAPFARLLGFQCFDRSRMESGDNATFWLHHLRYG